MGVPRNGLRQQGSALRRVFYGTAEGRALIQMRRVRDGRRILHGCREAPGLKAGVCCAGCPRPEGRGFYRRAALRHMMRMCTEVEGRWIRFIRTRICLKVRARYDQRLAFGSRVNVASHLAGVVGLGHAKSAPKPRGRIRAEFADGCWNGLCVSGSDIVAGTTPYVDFRRHLAKTGDRTGSCSRCNSVLVDSGRPRDQSGRIGEDTIRRCGNLSGNRILVVCSGHGCRNLDGNTDYSSSHALFDTGGIRRVGGD